MQHSVQFKKFMGVLFSNFQPDRFYGNPVFGVTPHNCLRGVLGVKRIAGKECAYFVYQHSY